MPEPLCAGAALETLARSAPPQVRMQRYVPEHVSPENVLLVALPDAARAQQPGGPDECQPCQQGE